MICEISLKVFFIETAYVVWVGIAEKFRRFTERHFFFFHERTDLFQFDAVYEFLKRDALRIFEYRAKIFG